MNIAQTLKDCGVPGNQIRRWSRRVQLVLDSPWNAKINRHPEAGQEKDGLITMHNGLKVWADSYLPGVRAILRLNKGCHEPEMEFWFGVMCADTMLSSFTELGCHWAWYTSWFGRTRGVFDAFLIDTVEEHLFSAKRNMSLVSGGHSVEYYLGNAAHQVLDHEVVHMDTQGAEFGTLRLWVSKRIEMVTIPNWFFISTHSAHNHEGCRELLDREGYTKLADTPLDQADAEDGLLVYRRD